LKAYTAPHIKMICQADIQASQHRKLISLMKIWQPAPRNSLSVLTRTSPTFLW
jgi:hypothetical protein